jgi:hypothetical protein
MLGTQGMMDRKARCGLERHTDIVVVLTAFGKAEPAPSQSTRNHPCRDLRSAQPRSLALAVSLGINAWPDGRGKAAMPITKP